MLQCDTLSSKTSPYNPSPKEQGFIDASGNGVLSKNSIGSASDATRYVNSLTDREEERALADTSGLNDMNAKISPHKDVVGDSSLNMPRATIKDLMEDVKIQVIVEMKNMIEENRKEMRDLNEENWKEMIRMNECKNKELERMLEKNRNGVEKPYEDVKDLHKKVD